MGANILDLGTAVNVSKPILVKLAAGTPVIQTSAFPVNQGRTSGQGPYIAGKPATVVATAAPGYQFLKWMENGVTVSVSARYTFTVLRSRKLVAGFIKPVPAGFAAIPAGSFQMGNAFSATGEGNQEELPVHSVYVSAFFMEKMQVTQAQWEAVRSWAKGYGYTDLSVALALTNAGPAYPVFFPTWYDAVKWCNARSQREGLTPCYTVGGKVYRSGQSEPVCNWSANGYRLPTEAEWEKAARGGLSGKRFPWGNAISRSQANYWVEVSGTANRYNYDFGTPAGLDPRYAMNRSPGTSPVGSFPANGYGLFDMAGNVWEWCWDWQGSYKSGAVSDPTGPDSLDWLPPTMRARIQRGGCSYFDAKEARVSNRFSFFPNTGNGFNGLRCVRR